MTRTERNGYGRKLGILAAISDPRIIYYGSYETAFLKACANGMAVLARARQRRSPLRCDKPPVAHLRSDLFPDVLKRFEGYRQVSRVPVVGCTSVGA